jgi:hypothetical protein
MSDFKSCSVQKKKAAPLLGPQFKEADRKGIRKGKCLASFRELERTTGNVENKGRNSSVSAASSLLVKACTCRTKMGAIGAVDRSSIESVAGQ